MYSDILMKKDLGVLAESGKVENTLKMQEYQRNFPPYYLEGTKPEYVNIV